MLQPYKTTHGLRLGSRKAVQRTVGKDHKVITSYVIDP